VTYSVVQLLSRADDAAVADVVQTELDAIDSSEQTSSRGLSTCSEADGPQ